MYKYMSLSWYFLIYMNSDCFRFQVPGLVVFLFGQWVFYRGKFYVGGRLWVSGVAGLWGGGPGDEGTSWSQNCEDWIDPTRFCLNPKASRFDREDSWSDAAKVRLQNSNSCRGWDFWRCGSGDFEGDFVGFQLEPSRQWSLGGVKKLVFVDDV